jgi:hypothetical protein
MAGGNPDIPHRIPLNCVSVLVLAGQGDTISCLAQIGDHMGYDLEFGLIEGGVSMSRSLEQSVLGTICGVWSVDVDRQSD